MINLMQQWDEFLNDQAAILGAEAIDKWARPLKVVDYDAANLYLEGGDPFQVTWFEQHLRPQILRFFKNNNGRPIKVHVQSEKKKGKNKEWKPSFNLSPDLVDPKCTFESYFPGQNATQITLLQEALKEGGFNPIYLQGASGCGKTHLLMASAKALSHKKCFYISIDTFTNHIVSAIRNGGMQLLRQLYREQDVLLVDDVERLAHRSATQEEFFHTFNALHMAGKQLILAGPEAPGMLKGIEPRLTSRFEWGLILTIERLNVAERERLIEKRAPQMPEDVRLFLASRFESTSSLLVALQMVKNQSLQAAEKTVAHLLEEQAKKAVTLDKIVKGVAEVFGIRQSDILGKSQNQECSLPRQIAMYICRVYLKLPFVGISRAFSRDHSTVMTSVKGIEKKIREQDVVVLSSVNQIKSKFRF